MSLQLIASDAKPISMYNCPKWDGCSASICVLNGPSGIHHPEEEVCPYLKEAAKAEAGIPPSGAFTDEIMRAARSVWARKEELPYQLRKILNRSAKSGSKRSSPTLLNKAA